MLSHSTAHRALRVRAYHSARRRDSRNNYTPSCSRPSSRTPRRYAYSALAEYSTTSHPGDTPPGCPSGGDNGSDGLRHRLLSHSTAPRVLRARAYHSPRRWSAPTTTPCSPSHRWHGAVQICALLVRTAPATHALKRNPSAHAADPRARRYLPPMLPYHRSRLLE